MSNQEQQYTFKWRHGPAPGLTFYSGTEIAYGPDLEIAERRARRVVAQRGCFSPGCLTFELTPPAKACDGG